MALKADIDELKEEVTSFWSTDLSTFFDGLENPPLRVNMAPIPNVRPYIEVPADGNEENQGVSTPRD